MQRKDRTPIQKAVDDVIASAMALAHQMRTGKPYDQLKEKFLRVTRKLEKTTGKR